MGANPYQAGFGAALSSATSSSNKSNNTQETSLYSTKQVIAFLTSVLAAHKLLVLGIFLLSLITIVAQLSIPIIIGRIIDGIMSAYNVNFALVHADLIGLILAIGIACITWYAQGVAINRVAALVMYDIRMKAFTKLENLSISFLDTHPSGDLMVRVIEDVEQVGDGLLQALTQLFSGTITIVGTLVFMLSISLNITLVVVLLTPLAIAVAWLIARFSHTYFSRQQDLQGNLAAYVQEMFSLSDQLALTGHDTTATTHFSSLNKCLNTYGLKAQFVSSLSNPATRFVNNIIFAAVATLGFLSVITGGPSAISVGEVQAFLAYSNQYTKPFNQISATVAQIQVAIASAERLMWLFDLQEQTETSTQPLPEDAFSKPLNVSHVDFGYTPQKQILHDIDFSIQPGQKIAIVGHTGCGKSTLINLLMRFYDPDKGTISLGSYNTKDFTKDSLRSHVGMVLQDSWVFDGTIAENIQFGRADASREQVIQAAQKAGANRFIELLPKGYDTEITNASENLSKGQKQLLCIARTMLKAPDILILDEATSSIDSKTESEVQKAFDRLIEGRTSIVVAHRLSTIQNADLILVMDKGKIVESGTHEELIAQNGEYARLYHAGRNVVG